jgi:hypothetical protein
MDKVIHLPAGSRQELFEMAAAERGLHPAIVEKDFWVCWVLKQLFLSPALKEHLVFKGGTSLSKVDGMVERFSEDIDLVLNWELLGYGTEGEDAWQDHPSGRKQDRFNQEVNTRAAAYLNKKLLPHLQQILSSVSGVGAAVSKREELTINIRYPSSLSLAALRPEVKLEIGPLASRVPSRTATIRPYAAEVLPRFFEDPDCEVIAIRGERTFWEKATILHQQAFRKTAIPKGYSRHYYDLVCMAQFPVKNSALADLSLLRDVVRFKEKFYRSSWARYEQTVPGSFRLTPTNQGKKELEADYRSMQPMFFSEPPGWDAILDQLQGLESEINQLSLEP